MKKQWILRTCRKAGISWTDLCFCRASPPHQGGEEEKEEEIDGRREAEGYPLPSPEITLLSSSSHLFCPRIPIHKRI